MASHTHCMVRARRAAAAVLIAIVTATAGLAGCCALTGRAAALPKNAIKPVVAVTSFENRSGFEGEWKIGSGMADLLVSELLASRNFEVVERQNFSTLLDEISRQKDAMFRAEGKVNSGKMKSAQYLIRGVINDFSQVGGGSLSVAARWLFFGGRGYVARVSLTLTIVDIESGRIVSSVQSAGLARARSAYVEAQYQGVHFGGDAFFRTPLGSATRDAIEDGVRRVTRDMPRQYWMPMIAEVDATRIVVNGGLDRGYREGQMYVVREPSQPVTDPATGDVIEWLPGRQIGAIRIVQAGPKLAVGQAVSGSGFQRGQCLERASEQAAP